MKFIMKKMVLLVIAIMISFTVFSNKTFAVSISLELSGDGIEKTQKLNGGWFYFCTKTLSIGDKMNIKAELVTSNDLYVIEGETSEALSKEDVTNKAEWKSSNESVAKIQNGEIEAVGAGVSNITVTYQNRTEEFNVYVQSEQEKKGWQFSINKAELKMNVGSSDIIEIDAKSYMNFPAVIVPPSVDYWKVEWEIDDETIAKCTPETGIETDRGIGTAGRATIQALKVGNTKLTAEVEIPEYGKEKFEIPITVTNTEKKEENMWNIEINKNQINVNVGSSEKLEITAKMKDGYITISQYEEGTDNWDVTWKIEDESIAKCTPEKGIVNNIHSGEQTVGRATIQGLKSGTTKLLIKVKVSTNRVEEFEIPIIINEIEKEKDDDKKEDKKEDNIVADKDLPKTGEKDFIIMVAIGTSIVTLSYLGIKLKNKF